MKFEDFKTIASEKDIVVLDTIYQKDRKFLIINIKPECVRVIHLNSFFTTDDKEKYVPALEMNYDMILNCKKIDNSELLYLINLNNSHISEAIQSLVNNE